VRSSEINAELLELLVALPHLHTLQVTERCYMDPKQWQQLTNARAFTSIDMCDSARASWLPTIASACSSGLTHLGVSYPRINGANFLALFSHPNLHQLQSLRISDFLAAGSVHDDIAAVPPSDFSAVFRLLPQLHTLHLVRISHVASMLQHLHQATALRHLLIAPDLHWSVEDDLQLPPLVGLEATLKLQPLLRCTLQLNEADEYRLRHKWTSFLAVHEGPAVSSQVPVLLVDGQGQVTQRLTLANMRVPI
jgi:hypothetical protein